MREDLKASKEKLFRDSSEATQNDTPWPLEPGERLLWEGVLDPSPTKVARRTFRRCVFYAAILAIPGAYMLALLLASTMDGVVIHPADPTMGDLLLPVQVVVGIAVTLLGGTGTCVLICWRALLSGHRLRRTHCAVTDRRMLVRCGQKVRCEPFGDAPGVVWKRDTEGRRSFAIWPWEGPLWRVVAGPLDAKQAAQVEAALREAHGLPPLDGTVDGTPAHAFPPWMGEEERKSIASLLLPGERLLWCGRPELRVSWIVDGIWDLWAAGLWLLAIRVACNHGVSPCDMGHFSKCVDILHTLFVRVGGVFGWLTGCVAGLMFLPISVGMSIGLFVFPLFFFAVPWWGRRPIRLTRYLVTDRRAWTMRLGNTSCDIGGVSILFGDAPGAEKRGKRFTVFLLLRNGRVFVLPHPLAMPTTTFADLSESDAHAAVDALNALCSA
jgi:hypothetical protein